MNEKLVRRMTYVPLDKLTSPPTTSGMVEVVCNTWWAVDPEKGALIYDGWATQTNSKEEIVRGLIAQLYPECEARFIPVAFLPAAVTRRRTS